MTDFSRLVKLFKGESATFETYINNVKCDLCVVSLTLPSEDISSRIAVHIPLV